MKHVVYFSLVLFFALFTSCSSNGAGTAAKKYMDYVKDGNYEKFADGIMYKETANKEDIEQSKAMIVALLKEKAAKEIEKKGGIEKIEVVSESLSENKQTADVILKTTYGDGNTEESNCKMVLDDGIWKMDIKK